MKKTLLLLAVALSIVALIAATVQAKVSRSAIWCDGELFGVTITPNDVPMKGPFDVIYSFMDSGLEGQRSISDAKPGDTDYNGGRWEVRPVEFTAQGIAIHDPDGDGEVNFELMSDQQLHDHEGLGHLVIGPPARYFVCPLHPQHGNIPED